LPGQLQQVFINLSLNALDAMPDGGTLTIRADRKRKAILVSVRDTGEGIPPAVGRRIFEPFFTTKQPGQGTGLGLAVSYGVVQKHGGAIDFQSSVGGGTLFTVELPVLDRTPDA
jgi:signal transduction histidine kinase